MNILKSILKDFNSINPADFKPLRSDLEGLGVIVKLDGYFKKLYALKRKYELDHELAEILIESSSKQAEFDEDYSYSQLDAMLKKSEAMDQLFWSEVFSHFGKELFNCDDEEDGDFIIAGDFEVCFDPNYYEKEKWYCTHSNAQSETETSQSDQEPLDEPNYSDGYELGKFFIRRGDTLPN